MSNGFYGTPGTRDASAYYCHRTDHGQYGTTQVVAVESFIDSSGVGRFGCPYCDSDEETRQRLTEEARAWEREEAARVGRLPISSLVYH